MAFSENCGFRSKFLCPRLQHGAVCVWWGGGGVYVCTRVRVCMCACMYVRACVCVYTSVMQGQQDSLVQTGSVQVSRNGLPCPAVQLQFLRVRCMGVRFGQDVAVPVLVEGVLQGVAVGRQTLGRKERVAAGERDRQADGPSAEHLRNKSQQGAILTRHGSTARGRLTRNRICQNFYRITGTITGRSCRSRSMIH